MQTGLRRGALVLALVSGGLGATAGQGDQAPTTAGANVSSPQDAEGLDTKLVYSVNRTPERPFDTARAVDVITSEEIWRRNARSLPELLMEVAGVFVQQTNYGGGSPIIRGLSGKQVLILLDGVKINNATYRFGFVQYLSTIDLGMVERIEIVRGVESVLGSDALGGVINIVTKKGPSAAEGSGFGGTIASRFSTADTAASGRAELRGLTDKLRFEAGVTYRNSEDVKGGGGIGTQKATGYDERAANGRFAFNPTTDRALALAYQVLEQHDVPRTDRIVDGTNLLFTFDPQRLQLLTLSYQDIGHHRLTDTLKATLYWNRQDEGRQEIRAASPGSERFFTDRQTVVGLNLEMASVLGQSHRLIWGADFSAEEILSRRFDRNLATQAVAAKRGNYTDGASYDTFALYLQDRFSAGSHATLSLGARYSRFSSAGHEDSSVGPLDLGARYQDVTGSASLVVHATHRLNLIANATRGFRAPNIDDLSVFDERKEGTEIPSPAVSPERSLTFEAGAKYEDHKLQGAALWVHSDLRELLVRARGSVDGLPFFDLNRNGVQDPAEPNVLQKQNIGKADISSIELDLSYKPAAAFACFGNLTHTLGDDIVADVPLPRIPPTFGALGVRWSAATSRRPWAELVFKFAGSQRRLSPVDVTDSRVGPGGTDAFAVVDVRGGMSIGSKFRATLAVENLFDRRYKYHGSGVFRPGLQLVLGAEARF